MHKPVSHSADMKHRFEYIILYTPSYIHTG